MTEENRRALINSFMNESVEDRNYKLSSQRRAEQEKGEAEACKILLSWYRKDAKNPIYHHGSYDSRVWKLDILTCICEFLEDFTFYRLDTNTERLYLYNNGRPREKWCWRYEYEHPLAKADYKLMKRRLEFSFKEFDRLIARYGQQVSIEDVILGSKAPQIGRNVSQIEPRISRDEAIGMKRVVSQVELFVDMYRSYSPLIILNEEGRGLGLDMYNTLKKYRNLGIGGRDEYGNEIQ